MTALFIYFATTNSGALGGLASLLINKLSEERQVLVRRLELGMTLAMCLLLLLSLGWGIGSPHRSYCFRPGDFSQRQDTKTECP